MQTPRSSQQRGIKFLDTKVFIVSLSLAVTVGLWNLFSNEAYLAAKAEANPTQPPSPASDGQDLPPLPTLVPLVNINVSAANPQASAPAMNSSSQPAVSGLRSVAAPDQVIVQKVKPVVVDGGAAFTSSGGGSSRSGAVTQTRSSRPK